MSASSVPKSYEPRPEAEVVAWGDLTEDQREAVKGTHGLFSRMAELADGKDKRDDSAAQFDVFLPHIDEKRRNHVVLIDGARGTGKTAAMLRLLVDWAAAVRGKLREDIGTAYDKSPITLDSAIVPVGLLDLQALSPKAMLGLHLAGHLQRVVEAMELRTSQSTRSVPWGSGESTDLKSRKAWQKFLHAAAVAWDGNLKERQGKIDPEAYVLELEHAERERLEIGATFRRFVDALVDDYHKHFERKPKPFFVITIDDADLNPQRTMEIFELIRVLWHPRVGFLIAGDGDLFVTVLEEHFKRAIETPQLYGTGNFGGGPVRAYFEHAQEAKKLAKDAYRKAMPPMQRYRTGLKPAERYNKIADVLATIPTSSSASSVTLDMRDYFAHDEDLKNSLPERIRDLLDLRAEIGRKKPSPTRFAWRLWEDAWARAEVPRELRDKEFVQFKEVGGKESLHVSNELKWNVEPMEESGFNLGSGMRVGVKKAVHLKAAIGNFVVPPEVSASFRLAFDVAVHEHNHSNQPHIAATRISQQEVVLIDHLSGEVTAAQAMWQLPLWDSFRDYVLFFRAWQSVVDSDLLSTDEPMTLDRLAQRYLDICLHSAAPNLQGRENLIQFANSPQSTWTSLAARLAEILPRKATTYRQDAVRQWAVSSACSLAAPEYGLSATAANEWLYALRDAFGDDWERRREMLKANRALNSKGLSIEEVDKRFSDHEWASVVEKRVTGRVVALEDLVELVMGLLGTIPADRRVKQPGLSRPNLMGYLGTHRQNMLRQAKTNQLLPMAKLTRRIPREKHGTAQMALSTLWTAANEHNSIAAAYMEWDKSQSKLKLHADLQFVIEQRPTDKKESGVVMKESLAHGLVCSIQLLDTRWHHKVQKHLNNATDVLLRIAWDNHVEAKDEKIHRSELSAISKIWIGAALTSKLQPVEIGWPIPDWPLLYQWEDAVGEWNREILEAQKMLVPDDPNVTQKVVDGLAFTFVEAIPSYTQGRPSFSTQFVEPEQWVNLGKQLPFRNLTTNDGTTLTSTKDEAYNDWWHRIIVIAAPELGLSPEAAGAFLNGLLEKHNIKNRPQRTRADARRHRREHAISCGVAENQVDRVLAEIDKQNPDHPWVKQISIVST